MNRGIENIVFVAIGAALILYGLYELSDGVTGALGGRAGGDVYISVKESPLKFYVNCGLKIGLGVLLVWKNLSSGKDD